ncbi:forkhead box [Branchiostoma belcheri]|nr:forkhead box [Branchiostoma belcheri]
MGEGGMHTSHVLSSSRLFPVGVDGSPFTTTLKLSPRQATAGNALQLLQDINTPADSDVDTEDDYSFLDMFLQTLAEFPDDLLDIGQHTSGEDTKETQHLSAQRLPVVECSPSMTSPESGFEDDQTTKPKSPSNSMERPNYTYIALIAMAIMSSENKRLPLHNIYQWISDNFPSFKQGQMSEERLPRDLLYSELKEGARPRGRPRLRYKDTLKRRLGLAGVSHQQLETLASDRAGWRVVVCNARRFTTALDLKIHSRIHIQDKPFTCDICKKKFTYLQSLKVHHHNSAPEKGYELAYIKWYGVGSRDEKTKLRKAVTDLEAKPKWRFEKGQAIAVNKGKNGKVPGNTGDEEIRLQQVLVGRRSYIRFYEVKHGYEQGRIPDSADGRKGMEFPSRKYLTANEWFHNYI